MGNLCSEMQGHVLWSKGKPKQTVNEKDREVGASLAKTVCFVGNGFFPPMTWHQGSFRGKHILLFFFWSF